MLESSLNPKTNLAAPPTQFLERALGGLLVRSYRPNPCKTKALCTRDSDNSRDVGFVKGDRVYV
jgi:hypothetical protein